MGGHGKGNVGAICASYLSEGDCAIDVGTADGIEATQMALKVGPSGFILALEPDPRRRTELEALSRIYPQVTCYYAAASDEASNGVLIHLPWNGLQSSLCRATIDDANCRNQMTYAMRLDDWDFKGRTPKVVKMDAQGWEGKILKGAQRLLSECPVWVWECWPWGLQQAGSSVRELFQTFAANGYAMHWSDGDLLSLEQAEQWAKGARKSAHTNLIAVRA